VTYLHAGMIQHDPSGIPTFLHRTAEGKVYPFNNGYRKVGERAHANALAWGHIDQGEVHMNEASLGICCAAICTSSKSCHNCPVQITCNKSYLQS